MKRKIMAVTLTAAMLAGLAAVPVWADDTGSDEGKVLNIYCWNEEFKSRLTDHYPGYEEVDGTHGKIGDVDVVWNITPSDDNAYQNNLDETLLKQADASADDKIDLFLVEADYALKYVNTDYTMPVADLGITEDEVADQYQYTKDVMTDADGNLKGLSWQGCPGTMIYRRDIAKEVFGTDDPAEVQKKVADWDTFKATAEELKEKGIWFVCADMGGETMYDLDLTGPMGLVIGNEGEGVSRLVREACDFTASIPMKGDIDSLNASVAAGVLAYEIVRQRLAKAGK